MSDNHKDSIEPIVIFKAELIDGKKIVFSRNSSHIPTLDYVVNELHYHITELRAIEKTKEAMKNAKIIKGPPSGLIDFLRRGHKR